MPEFHASTAELCLIFDDVKAYGRPTITPVNYAAMVTGEPPKTNSVPGRGSEGCIRMRDEDIIHLKENYAFVGMNVYIEKDI